MGRHTSLNTENMRTTKGDRQLGNAESTSQGGQKTTRFIIQADAILFPVSGEKAQMTGTKASPGASIANKGTI
jgi:hypothetical protein